MNQAIESYNASLPTQDETICNELMKIIDQNLKFTKCKIWHRHPVWFIDGNPIVGYCKLKDCVRLMFWSGVGFEEPDLMPGTGKFKDASIRYTTKAQVNETDLKRWLEKAETIQWDYKNIVKRKGKLERIT